MGKKNYFGDENKVYFIDKYYYENYGKNNLEDKLFLLEKADPKSFKVFDNADDLAYDKNAIYHREKRNEIDFDYKSLELIELKIGNNILHYAIIDKNKGFFITNSEIELCSKFKVKILKFLYDNYEITNFILVLLLFGIPIILFFFLRNSIIPFIISISLIFFYPYIHGNIYYWDDVYNAIFLILFIFFIVHFILSILIGTLLMNFKYSIIFLNSVSLILFILLLFLFFLVIFCATNHNCQVINSFTIIIFIIILYLGSNVYSLIELREKYKKETKKLDL